VTPRHPRPGKPKVNQSESEKRGRNEMHLKYRGNELHQKREKKKKKASTQRNRPKYN